MMFESLRIGLAISTTKSFCTSVRPCAHDRPPARPILMLDRAPLTLDWLQFGLEHPCRKRALDPMPSSRRSKRCRTSHPSRPPFRALLSI